MITPTASTTAIIRTSARLAASPFADASYYTPCRGSTRLGGAKRQRRHAPAHRGAPPGLSRRPHTRRDPDPAWRGQAHGRYVSGDAALWTAPARGARKI